MSNCNINVNIKLNYIQSKEGAEKNDLKNNLDAFLLVQGKILKCPYIIVVFSWTQLYSKANK